MRGASGASAALGRRALRKHSAVLDSDDEQSRGQPVPSQRRA